MRAPPPLCHSSTTRPHSASWAAHLGLPAGLPRGRGDGWVGARWPTVSLVLPSALGVPSPQCLLEVPSSHTPSPASISDLLGSKHLPGPAAVTVLRCLHLLSFLHSQHGLEGEAAIGLPTPSSLLLLFLFVLFPLLFSFLFPFLFLPLLSHILLQYLCVWGG